jgi:hypothetical protein
VDFDAVFEKRWKFEEIHAGQASNNLIALATNATLMQRAHWGRLQPLGAASGKLL